MTTAPTPAQVTMTLAAIAATAATPRPSGETPRAQTERARLGIEEHLDNPALATGSTWQLMWLVLSPDNANLAYIAWNGDGSNQIAVAVRGTVDNPVDMMEDLDVGTLVPFTAGGSPDIAVSAGAMAAFTQIVNTRGVTATPAGSGGPGGVVPTNATLTEALRALVQLRSPQPTVYVTGHSLGGCIATMLAAHLQTLTWQPAKPRFALVTFAAPTAGAQSFAKYVDSLPWLLNEGWYNTYDLVPRAWDDLSTPRGWYPAPGPAANGEVDLLLEVVDGLRQGNAYVQPGTRRALNGDYAKRDDELVNKTTADFLGQVAFQHANSTYLNLLNAPDVPVGPVVTGISPTSGQGGTPVTITGEGFTKDALVDFGPIPCDEPTVHANGTGITVTAPDGHGLVDVRVTTNLGTSPAVALGQFAYDGGPEPVVVSAVSPRGGKLGTPVTIYGSGFRKGATVRIKDVDLTDVSVVSSTQITAKVPMHDAKWPKTVDITVTVGVATSPTSPADEFTYPV
jgi:pimeloyl-ACP methyl ester carboxylesterase